MLPHITTQISVPIINPTHLGKNWVMSTLENTTFHDSYHPLPQIENFMQELVDAHPETARLINLGRSAEGRDILGLTISIGDDDESEEFNGEKKKRKKKKKKKGPRKQKEKLGFVIQGAQHAREVFRLPFYMDLFIINCMTVDSDGYISLCKPCASNEHI